MIKRLIRLLLGLWGPLKPGDYWDDTKIFEVAVRSSTLVDQELLRVQRQSRAYATQVLREVKAAPTRTLEPVKGIYPRAFVTIPEVYVRPAKEFRWVQSQAQKAGMTDPDAALKARRAARDRIWELVETDVKLAQNRQERDTYANGVKVIGYRRVLHPELSKTGVCGLCVVAATRFYTVKDLQAIHDRCKCSTAPLTEDNDPGLKLNEADLRKFYAAAGSTSGMSTGKNPDGGRGLKSQAMRFQTLDDIQELIHGEIGPVLVDAKHSFRDHTAAGRRAWREPTADDLRSMLETQIDLSQTWASELDAAVKAGRSHEFQWMGTTYTAEPNAEAAHWHRDAIKKYRRRLSALR